MSNRVMTALRQIGPKLLVRTFAMAALLVAAGILINQYSFEELVDALDFSAAPDAGWLNGRVAYFALGAIFTAAGGPRQVVSFFAAYFFGLAVGIPIALAATLTGSTIAVSAAILFGGVARRLIRGRMDVAARVWTAHAFGVTLMLRLLPVGSNLVTNLAAGVVGVPLAGFLFGSALGYLPQTLVFGLLGAGVNVGSGPQILLSVALFAVSALIGVWVYARYRKTIRARETAETGTAV